MIRYEPTSIGDNDDGEAEYVVSEFTDGVDGFMQLLLPSSDYETADRISSYLNRAYRKGQASTTTEH